MEGATYLHFNITNMITIWIMGAIGLAFLAYGSKLYNNRNAA